MVDIVVGLVGDGIRWAVSEVVLGKDLVSGMAESLEVSSIQARERKIANNGRDIEWFEGKGS